MNQPSGRQVICVGPGPSGLSQYCWASSPSYSLNVAHVLANRIWWLLRVVLISVLEDGGLLLKEAAERHLRVLLQLSLRTVQSKVLSPLGYELLPLAAAHLLSHMDPSHLWIVDPGGHEGLCLRLLDGSDRKYTSVSHRAGCCAGRGWGLLLVSTYSTASSLCASYLSSS